MRPLKILLFSLFLFSCCSIRATAQPLYSEQKVIAQMKKTADYQIAQPWPLHLLEINPYATGPKSWVAGAFYAGIVDLYRVTGEKAYLDYLVDVGTKNSWEPGPRPREADDQAVLQTYLGLYDICRNPQMLAAAKNTLDLTMREPVRGDEEWFWSDALFMAPPIWAHYAAISGEAKYLDFLDRMWWEAVEALYSTEYNLFYRDERFKEMRSRGGKPVFWSRGNGWVAAGLVRILDYMPLDYPSRHRYERLLREMAVTLKAIQSPDGFWKSSLLDADEFPYGESSGTSFFCYMFAWGINHGVLDRADYLPVVTKAWQALVSALHKNGKLGYAQGGGDRPHPCYIDCGEPYAVGGFLMAGKEVVDLIRNQSLLSDESAE